MAELPQHARGSLQCRFGQEQQQAAQANTQSQRVLQYSRMADPSQQVYSPRMNAGPAIENPSQQLPDSSFHADYASASAQESRLQATAAVDSLSEARPQGAASPSAVPMAHASNASDKFAAEEALLERQGTRAQKPPQHLLTERDQQGSPAGKGPGQTALRRSQSDLQAQSMHSSSSRQMAQRPLRELEQQGSIPVMQSSQQSGQSTQQLPLPCSASPHEFEHVAALNQPVGRRSPTRDLTELEQQGSFTLGPTLSQTKLKAQLKEANLTQSSEGIAAAELALDIARRKAAQAELERQYSALQLQHQQVCSTAVSAYSNNGNCMPTPCKTVSITHA